MDATDDLASSIAVLDDESERLPRLLQIRRQSCEFLVGVFRRNSEQMVSEFVARHVSPL
jgi:hypothetical protein